MKKKNIFLLIIIFVVTGCTKLELNKIFKEMRIEKINNYSVDLRISGEKNGEIIKTSHRITNFNDEQIIIFFSERNSERELIEHNYVYQDNNLFVLRDDLYIESQEVFPFMNTNILLDGLTKTKDESKEIVEDNSYNKIVRGNLNKSYVDILLKEYKLNSDFKKATFEFYLKSDNTIERLIYQIDDLTINALFYDIGESRKVEINK